VKRAALALLMAGVLIAPAAAATQAVAASDAAQLVGLLASDASLTRLATRMFERHVENDANLPAEQRRLFAANPGMKAHVATAIQREMTATLKRELPALRTQLTDVARTDLTATETREMLAFLRTPTGRKVLASVYRGIAESGARSEQEVQQAAVNALMAGMGPEDYPELLAFGRTSAARKLQRLQPRISTISRAWAEDVTERHEARLLRIVETAQREFVKKAKG
jgi:hypothetical protein